MNINDFFLVALGALTANKLRSLLTMLGIIIGVAAVIVMTALGEGAQAQIQQQIASLGTNIIIIVPGAVRQGSVSMGGGTGTRLVLDDVTKIERNAGLIEGISPIVRLSVQAVGGAGNWNTQVNGVSVAYFSIRDWLVASGDVFTDADVRSQAKVCILGQTIAKNLFPNDDPVGQQIRLRNVPFKIIGLLSEKGQGASGTDQDDVILAPYTTVQNRMSGFRPIQQILCKAVNENQMNEATEEIRSLVRESHKLQDGDDDDFTIRSQTDIAATAQETTRVLTLLLASVAGVSLVVGGIGIMNIMLVSVTERTREVGIRRAIGATRFVILGQFLVEAMVLSLLGGVLGITVGFLTSLIIENVSAWRMVITPGIVFLSFGFSAGVGIFFGFYPARKASLLNTIDALRYE
jgi:putative ABC transport system permease protein